MGTIAVGRDQLDVLIETLLNKIKNSSALIVTEEDLGSKAAWNEFLMSILEDNLDAQFDTRAVSAQMLTEILSFANYSTVNVVKGSTITSAVPNPMPNALYFLKDIETGVTSLWTYNDVGSGSWVSLTMGTSSTDMKVVNTRSPEDVANIISHINRGTDDYASSTNVKGSDIVDVTALTKVLIGLGGAQIVEVPYSEGKGRLINKVVTKPSLNTFYVYQQSSDIDDWVVYTVVNVTVNDVNKIVWVKVGDVDQSGSGSTDVNLTNYWSKDELVPFTDEEIIDIVNEAARKAGF